MTCKAAVLGYPVKKSKSPLIFDHWFHAIGIDAAFEAIESTPDDLPQIVQQLREDSYAGFCVTIPHKQTILALCDEVDETAQAMGAANSIAIRDGRLYATNTDGYGFLENLKQTVPAFAAGAGPITVLGAGGATRAVVYALLQEGATDIRLTNRSMDKAAAIQSLAPDRIHVIPWEEREEALSGAQLLVNTTSLGMEGMPPLDLALDTLQQNAIVYDIVYYPLMTPLLQQAQEGGHTVVTGIGMLIHQAVPSFRNWFGVTPSVTDDLKEKVLT